MILRRAVCSSFAKLGRSPRTHILHNVQSNPPVPGRSSVRLATHAATSAQALHIERKGEPLDVLKVTEMTLQACEGTQVQVRMLAAPVNPSDINTVQGVYPLQPSDGVGGHEGVGEVVEAGPDAQSLSVGDRVVPLMSGQGTWRTRGVYDEQSWHKVDASLRLEDAATMTINPGTALGMLEQFVDLHEGDVVVQNGGNSSVGKHVIAIAKSKGIKTINIVRDRSDWLDTVTALEKLGADLVATPETVREAAKDAGLPPPKLGLNCVGGDVATTMLKMLAKSGTLVTYGAMAKLPVSVPAPLLIFKDVRLRGFWISGNSEAAQDTDVKRQLLDRVGALISEGVISASCTRVPFDKWQRAFGDGVEKPVLVFKD